MGFTMSLELSVRASGAAKGDKKSRQMVCSRRKQNKTQKRKKPVVQGQYMVSGTLLFWFLGSGPNRGRSTVEWEDF